MKRRVFIAVNLPEAIKKKLADYQEKWPELPCRWTKKDNLHITLLFLGYLTDEETAEVCQITKETVLKYEPFQINLNKIIYGPPKIPYRMVWAEGGKSKELGKLYKDLEKSLLAAPVKFEAESRPYVSHITLGRLKLLEFKQMEVEEKPQIAEDIDLNFEVSSIEVMESRLRRSGPVYTILESCPLKI